MEGSGSLIWFPFLLVPLKPQKTAFPDPVFPNSQRASGGGFFHPMSVALRLAKFRLMANLVFGVLRRGSQPPLCIVSMVSVHLAKVVM